MEISLISVGSNQILRLPQPSTEEARRFCSLRDTYRTDKQRHTPRGIRQHTGSPLPTAQALPQGWCAPQGVSCVCVCVCSRWLLTMSLGGCAGG